jgi:hypothetical protein
MAMGRHHDQVGVPVASRLHDFLGRVAGVLKQGASDPQSRARLERQIQGLENELTDTSLSEYVRRDIERDIEQKRRRLEALRAGASMCDWLEHLIRHPLIPQFFAREHATAQAAQDWGQAAWERNERAVRAGAKTFLVREFATPGWDSLTLETLGLAEVTYGSFSSSSCTPCVGSTVAAAALSPSKKFPGATANAH